MVRESLYYSIHPNIHQLCLQTLATQFWSSRRNFRWCIWYIFLQVVYVHTTEILYSALEFSNLINTFMLPNMSTYTHGTLTHYPIHTTHVNNALWQQHHCSVHNYQVATIPATIVTLTTNLDS